MKETKRICLQLQAKADKTAFKDQVESLSIELRSDATVRFFEAKYQKVNHQLTVIEATLAEDNYAYYQHYKFRKDTSTKTKGPFQRYVCSKVNIKKCSAVIQIPKTASEGKRLAIYTHSKHSHSSAAENYDDQGRNIYLNQLAETVEILENSGVDVKQAFNIGLNDQWASNQNDQVKAAAELFNEYHSLFITFCKQFIDEKDSNATIYARFKVNIQKDSSFKDRYEAFAKVGWRSGTSEDRMRIERRADAKVHWMKTIRFHVQTRPIVESDLLIPTCDLHSKLSEIQAKSEEALIEELHVKPEGQKKLTLNERSDKCDPEYRFKNIVDDYKCASFILLQGIYLADAFHLADYRPLLVGNTYTIDNTELKARLFEVNLPNGISLIDHLFIELQKRDTELQKKDTELQKKDTEIERLTTLVNDLELKQENISSPKRSRKLPRKI